jgi:hypothetical protein
MLFENYLKGSLPDIFLEIPILISKYQEGNLKGWRAEISDNYEDYKPTKSNDVNFEDLTFHFKHPIDTYGDGFMFQYKKEAVECANFCNKKYINNKAKIWFAK